MRTSKRQAGAGSLSSSPALVNSQSASFPGALQQPLSPSLMQKRSKKINSIRFPKQRNSRLYGRSSGGVRNDVVDSPPATTSDEKHPNRRHKHHRQRNDTQVGEVVTGGALPPPLSFFVPDVSDTSRSSIVGEQPLGEVNPGERSKAQQVSNKENIAAFEKCNNSCIKGKTRPISRGPCVDATRTNTNLSKRAVTSQVRPSPQRSRFREVSGASHFPTPRVEQVSKRRTLKEQVEVVDMTLTAAATLESSDVQQPSPQKAPVVSEGEGVCKSNGKRSETVEVAKQRKVQQTDKSRALNAPKSRSKNMKGVTASIPAKRLCQITEATIVEPAVTAAPQQPLQSVGLSSSPAEEKVLFGSQLSMKSDNAFNDTKRTRDVLPVRELLPSTVSGLDNCGALPLALHDPAIVEHHVRRASIRASPVPVLDTTAMAELPSDPCVVKVVCSVVSTAAAAAATGSSGRGANSEHREGSVTQGTEATRVMSSLPAVDPNGAGSARVAGSDPPPQISEEDTRLRRRGLRFEAAPWRPSGHVTFNFDDAALANASAVPLQAFPLLPETYSNGLSLFAASVPLPPFQAPTSDQGGVVAAAAPPPAVPTPTVTSTLAEEGGEAAAETAALAASVELPSNCQPQRPQTNPDSSSLSLSPTPPSLPECNAAPPAAVSAPATSALAFPSQSVCTAPPASPTTPAAPLNTINSSSLNTRNDYSGNEGAVSAFLSSPQRPVATPLAVTNTLMTDGVVVDGAAAALAYRPHSSLQSPGSSVARSEASPQRESIGSPSCSILGGAVTAAPAIGFGSRTMSSVSPMHGLTHASVPGSITAGATVAAPPPAVNVGGVWGTNYCLPFTVVREDDGESSRGTPLLMSPALGPVTSVTSDSTTTTVATAAAAAALVRPATAPAIRRSAMTVTNTATGARMSSSTLTTPSGSPTGLWTVAENVGGGCLISNSSSSSSSAPLLPIASSANHTSSARVGLTGTMAPLWASSNSGNQTQVYSAVVRSAGSTDYSMREFPAVPYSSSFANTTTSSLGHHHSPQQQQYSRHSLNGFGFDSSNHNSTDPSNGVASVTATGVGASRGGGPNYLGSPQLSLQNPTSLLLTNLQFPRNTPSTSPASGDRSAVTTAENGNESSFVLLQHQQQQQPSQPHFGLSPPMQGKSDIDCVRHNRVAVSDMAAKNETTLVDSLFADAEADVIEDDESEMDVDDNGMGNGSGDWWPAYPITTSTSPHAGVDSPSTYTSHSFRKQQQQGFASSPPVAGMCMTFGGGYWYQSGSAGGPQQQPQHRNSGGSAARPRFSPENHVHQTISASCASVASSTISLLDPKQPPVDFGAAAYETGEDEEEWEMNSSAYADSLDEAQIQWIEEQLKATENPVGYF